MENSSNFENINIPKAEDSPDANPEEKIIKKKGGRPRNVDKWREGYEKIMAGSDEDRKDKALNYYIDLLENKKKFANDDEEIFLNELRAVKNGLNQTDKTENIYELDDYGNEIKSNEHKIDDEEIIKGFGDGGVYKADKDSSAQILLEQDEELRNGNTEIKIEDIEKEDPEMAEAAEEAIEEIENMPPKEKKKWHEGIGNLGYLISEKKNKAMGGIIGLLAKKAGYREDKKRKNNATAKYFNNYAKIFAKSAENDRKLLEKTGKSGVSTSLGAGRGAGTLLKYGRVLYDAADTGSLRTLNPFRHVTAGAMFVGRSSEAFKETRLESEKALENTRVNDQERAYNEAWAIHEKAFQGKNSNKEIKKEDLEKAYRDNLPEDIQKRFARGDFEMTKWYKFYLNKSLDLKVHADRLNKALNKIEKLEDPDEKERKRAEILARNEALINDLDRMVGDAGTIDTLAYVSRTMEKTGKGVAVAMMLDSARMLGQGAWNLRHLFDKYEEEVASSAGSKIASGKIVYPDKGETEGEVVAEKEEAPLKVGEKKDLGEKDYLRDNESYDKYIAYEDKKEDVYASEKIKSDTGNLDNVDPRGENLAEAETETAIVSEVKIEGKIDTYSEALREALNQADSDTQDNCIHKYLDADVEINNENRKSLLAQTVGKLSISNTNGGPDVKNLIYEGNVGQLKEDGTFEIVKGESDFVPRAVKETELRANAEKLRMPEEKIYDTKTEIPQATAEVKSITNPEVAENTEKGFSGFKLPPEAGPDHVVDLRANESLDVGFHENEEDVTLEQEMMQERKDYLLSNGVSEKLYNKMGENLKNDYTEFLYKHRDITELPQIVDSLPEGIKTDAEASFAYLKVIAGDSNERGDGLKKLFNLKNTPAEGYGYKYNPEKNLFEIPNSNIGGRDGAVILLDKQNDKIGVQVDGGQSWGLKPRKFWQMLKSGEAGAELSSENLEKLRAFLDKYNRTLPVEGR